MIERGGLSDKELRELRDAPIAGIPVWEMPRPLRPPVRQAEVEPDPLEVSAVEAARAATAGEQAHAELEAALTDQGPDERAGMPTDRPANAVSAESSPCAPMAGAGLGAMRLRAEFAEAELEYLRKREVELGEALDVAKYRAAAAEHAVDRLQAEHDEAIIQATSNKDELQNMRLAYAQLNGLLGEVRVALACRATESVLDAAKRVAFSAKLGRTRTAQDVIFGCTYLQGHAVEFIVHASVATSKGRPGDAADLMCEAIRALEMECQRLAKEAAA